MTNVRSCGMPRRAAAMALLNALAAMLHAGAGTLSAQVPNASAAALGMGENYTAAARGWSAVSWNPANLGLLGGGGFTFTMGAVGGIAGIGPITMADLKAYEDRLLPVDVKEQWLTRIRNEGGQSGAGGFDGTWLGVRAGPLAFQLSTSARAANDVSPGFAELLLFGNADDLGNPRILDLSGSSVKAGAWTTGALSVGAPAMHIAGGWLALGATAKYTVGHVLAYARESFGTATADPIGVRMTLPLVHTNLGDDETPMRMDNGAGIGVDAGIAWQRGGVTLAASAQNVMNTFAWEETSLVYRPAEVTLSMSQQQATMEEQAYAAAPETVRDDVANLTFEPAWAAGVMVRRSERLMLTADARWGPGDGFTTRPARHIGAGAELFATQWLPLRAGAAWIEAADGNAGFQLGGGAGIALGGFDIAASALRRGLELGAETVFLVSLLSRGR